MAADPSRAARLPPRWFIRTAWSVHRGLYRVTGGRSGLRRATDKQWGMLRLRTVGRRTGAERLAILGYLEDGRDLVTLAMNGWGEPEPPWWLNLQAHPDATVDLVEGQRAVHARAAVGDERRRIWACWAMYDKSLDRYAALRSHETAVVILEPVSGAKLGCIGEGCGAASTPAQGSTPATSRRRPGSRGGSSAIFASTSPSPQ